MLDLLIINPGAAQTVYGPLGDSLVAVEPPVWARIIADYAANHGQIVRIHDMEAERTTPVEVARLVAQLRPRLVCVAVYGHQPSASTQQMVGASVVCAEIRRLTRRPMIIVGGHPSALPERTLKEENVDFVCAGEGPITVVALLQALEHPDSVGGSEVWSRLLRAIPGLVFHDPLSTTPVIISNPAAPLMDNLDVHLTGNAWNLLPMHRYRPHNWQCFGEMERLTQPYASIHTSLSCPYKCNFCCIAAPFLGSNKYRMREPAKVVEEIVHLYWSYKVRTFKIVDEMFVLNVKHYTEIAQRLVDSGIAHDLNIWAYARVDTVKPDTLALLRRAGFRWLALGIESGSKHVRDGADKALKSEDIFGIVKAIQDADINVIGNYIFGLPDDTMETMQATLGLALALKTEFANFYCAMAYPGSRLYSEALTKGWDLPETWAGYSQHNYVSKPLATETLTAAQVLKFRDEAFIAYFTDPSYLDHIHWWFGPGTVSHVEQMTQYKLPRKLLGHDRAA